MKTFKKAATKNLYVKKREFYDPLTIPPSFELAQLHCEANIVKYSKNNDHEEHNEENICPCCGSIKSKSSLSLGCSTNEMNHLGLGYSLFFEVIKGFLGIILFNFFVLGIY